MKYTDLCAQADKALEGVTEGPWSKYISVVEDARGYNVADLSICVHDEDAIFANATFIAFARAWVPAAAAAIRELEAERNHIREQRNFTQRQVVSAEARVAELTRERDAERERCAMIAEDAAPATQDFDHSQMAETCMDIAAAIRKGATP